jgi:hypothetical protein
VFVDSNFRNTYTIIGFCGIDQRVPALYFPINDERNDSLSFQDTLCDAIRSGFLRAWDVLVLDNAAIHFKGQNDGLEEWLWTERHILCFALPTRSPELNPIELVWHVLVRQLKTFPLDQLARNRHAVADASFDILSKVTHQDVATC